MRYLLALTLLFALLATCPFQAGADDDSPSGAPASPQSAALNLQQAREYMVELINRDRAEAGLVPVALDEVACRAAQLHAQTMATSNTNSHWHPDGSKPPQRYTECGGNDYVMENSHGTGLLPPWNLSVDPRQAFTRAQIESEEKGFFDEKPPNDGHRRNILDPKHTHVGLGFVLVHVKYEDRDASHPLVACAQEFINKYGNIRANARYLVPESTFVLTGPIDPRVQVYSVNVYREDLPKPLSPDELRSNHDYRGGYTLANDRVTSIFTSAGTRNELGNIELQGDSFICRITPPKSWKPGLYYILVWAKEGNGSDSKPFPMSMRTVQLRAAQE